MRPNAVSPLVGMHANRRRSGMGGWPANGPYRTPSLEHRVTAIALASRLLIRTDSQLSLPIPAASDRGKTQLQTVSNRGSIRELTEKPPTMHRSPSAYSWRHLPGRGRLRPSFAGWVPWPGTPRRRFDASFRTASWFPRRPSPTAGQPPEPMPWAEKKQRNKSLSAAHQPDPVEAALEAPGDAATAEEDVPRAGRKHGIG